MFVMALKQSCIHDLPEPRNNVIYISLGRVAVMLFARNSGCLISLLMVGQGRYELYCSLDMLRFKQ